MSEEEIALAKKKKTAYKAFLIGGSFIILFTTVIFAVKRSKN